MLLRSTPWDAERGSRIYAQMSGDQTPSLHALLCPVMESSAPPAEHGEVSVSVTRTDRISVSRLQIERSLDGLPSVPGPGAAPTIDKVQGKITKSWKESRPFLPVIFLSLQTPTTDSYSQRGKPHARELMAGLAPVRGPQAQEKVRPWLIWARRREAMCVHCCLTS